MHLALLRIPSSSELFMDRKVLNYLEAAQTSMTPSLTYITHGLASPLELAHGQQPREPLLTHSPDLCLNPQPKLATTQANHTQTFTHSSHLSPHQRDRPSSQSREPSLPQVMSIIIIIIMQSMRRRRAHQESRRFLLRPTRSPRRRW